MEEGRLGTVLRQEERHRKFVYMMNDIVRARLGLYSNFLTKERRENTLKLVKNCAGMRKAVVRQRVLRQCLEARRSQVTTSDGQWPAYGQYGGQPLWTLNRDVEQVIADNHPRLRRIKRVQEAMRHSLESGAILDDAAMARRMQAFFQLKEKSLKPEKAAHQPTTRPLPLVTARRLGADLALLQPSPPVQRGPRFGSPPRLPPIRGPVRDGVATDSGEPAPSPRRDSSSSATEPGAAAGAQAQAVAQNGSQEQARNVAEKASLEGRTSLTLKVKDNQGLRNRSAEKYEVERRSTGSDVERANFPSETSSVHSGSVSAARQKMVAPKISYRSDTRPDRTPGQDTRKNVQYSKDKDRSTASRPRLVLPPIETTKALVSRT